MKNEELRMKNGLIFEKALGYSNLITSKSFSFSIRIVKFYLVVLLRTEEF